MESNVTKNADNSLTAKVDGYTIEISSIGKVTYSTKGESSELTIAKASEKVFSQKTTITDSKENSIVIPEGFKIAKDSGDTVQKGVVIEDVNASKDNNVQGSQFVWIPVGDVVKDNGETSKIQLGRYTFDKEDGTPTLAQAATQYADEIQVKNSPTDNYYFQELATYREGIVSQSNNGLNTTAKDLKCFIENTQRYKGFYLARYEACYASGSTISDYKCASKVSRVSEGQTNMSYEPGVLWFQINQIDASKVSINTYKSSTSVQSDLVNSYAWDTAIVYIQEMGNPNYANQTGDIGNPIGSGTTGDEKCKINDMSSNVWECTTENSFYPSNDYAYPVCTRGGDWGASDTFTAKRNCSTANGKSNGLGFRILLDIQ